MGVKIYNEADLKVVHDLKAAANAKLPEMLDSLSDMKEGHAILAEAIATTYEDNLVRAEKVDEILATIYEAVLEKTGGAE